jgi:hypothetical protein
VKTFPMLSQTGRLKLMAGLCGFLSCIAQIVAGQLAQSLLSPEAWSQQQVAPGIELRQRQFEELFGAAQFISILAVKLDDAQIRFAAAEQFGRERMIVPELAENAGAVAAINGAFFRGTPTKNSGILKIDGAVLPFLHEEPEDLRFVAGVALGIDADDGWHFRLRPGHRWPEDWPAVRHALAGGHPLILRSRIFSVVEQESYDPRRESSHAGRRNPRTAIGITPDRVAVLVTADGRHSGIAEGLTMREMALLMKALGCDNAINLDGGGSTTMWVRDRGTVNRPSDNRVFDTEGARRVGSAVIVIIKEDEPRD